MGSEWLNDVLTAIELAKKCRISIGSQGDVLVHDEDHHEEILAALMPDRVEVSERDKSPGWMLWFTKDGRHNLTLFTGDEAKKDAIAARYAKPEAVTA